MRWVAAFVLLSAVPAFAEPPELKALFPGGVREGRTTDVTIIGRPGDFPVRVWTADDGLAIEATEKGDALLVTAPPGTRTGLHWLRLFNRHGASALKSLIVGGIRESKEAEPNNALADAEQCQLPVVVNGVLHKTAEVDTFAVRMEAGETLIASIEANRSLGSPMDAILQLLSPQGFVVEQNDDHRGFDPQIVHTVRHPGTWFVRLFAFPSVPTSSIRFAGGPDFVYRLTLTSGPFIDHIRPTGEPVGWNLTGRSRAADGTSEGIVADPAVDRLHPAGVAPGTHLFAVDRLSTDSPILDEHPASTHSHVIPFRVAGCIARAEEIDTYRFSTAEATTLRITVESRSFDAPLDSIVRIRDAERRQLIESDDASRTNLDPSFTWKAPSTADYTLEVTDRFGHGGQRYWYLLSVAAEPSAFQLTTTSDRIIVEPDKPARVPVSIVRSGGFNRDISISTSSLPPGIMVGPVTSAAAGKTSKAVELVFSTDGKARFNGPIRILGSSRDPRYQSSARFEVLPSKLRTDVLWLTAARATEPQPNIDPHP